MSSFTQIPRMSLLWILAALIAVVLPHGLRMPLWVSALCVICVALRVLMHQGRLSYPGAKIKGILVFSALVLTVAHFGREILSTDATIGVLILGASLKLLEMRTRRDALIVVFLCYFTGIAEFIYSQSIFVAFYMFLVMVVVSSALMSLNQHRETQKPVRTLKLSLKILLQSIPLMLALFILLPRISPLWSVPMQSNAGVSGLSDTMSPGDIGQLIGSPEVAFKVKFTGEVPSNDLLYWRGITLDLFDGRQWSKQNSRFGANAQFLGQNARDYKPWYSSIDYLGSPVQYNVVMEPTFQNWLFTLKIPQINRDGLILTESYQVESLSRITQRRSYDVTSWIEHETSATLSRGVQRRALLLPQEGNEQARAFALQLRNSVETDRDYIDAVLNHFTQEPFFYTLEPALLGADPIDDFFFSTREGFCEHFSSTFTFLMRAANIPARVVTGYQGGEINPYDSTLIVRQYDAHAWSEVWLEDEGWIRIDPTAAVAPQRISQGSEITLQEEEGFLSDAGLSRFLFTNSALLNELRFRIEAIDYAWTRWVLNYDRDTQFSLFSRLFGVVSSFKIFIFIFVFFIFAMGLLSYFILRSKGKSKSSPATELYLKFCRKMEKIGCARSTGETPSAFCHRLTEMKPALSEQVKIITQLYVDLAFRSTVDGGIRSFTNKANTQGSALEQKRFQLQIKLLRNAIRQLPSTS